MIPLWCGQPLNNCALRFHLCKLELSEYECHVAPSVIPRRWAILYYIIFIHTISQVNLGGHLRPRLSKDQPKKGGGMRLHWPTPIRPVMGGYDHNYGSSVDGMKRCVLSLILHRVVCLCLERLLDSIGF